nr:hypothetical protein [Tanacetum cinerariifolium]
NRRDLPKDTPIDRLEVLRYGTEKGRKVRMGRLRQSLHWNEPNKVLCDEVSISIEGAEECKRNVRIKGEKKAALHTLRQKPGQFI